MIIEKCIICEREMKKTNTPRKARSSSAVTRYFRHSGAITCSKTCSKIYYRIYHRIKNKGFLKIKINKDHLKERK